MSVYIQKKDYFGIIKEEYLDQITKQNPALLDEVEAMAMDEVKIFIPDIDFSTNTNKALKMRVMDIALYHIHSRLPVKDVPQIRIDRYLQAIAWFEKITSGELSINVTTSTKTTEVTQGVKYGSNIKKTLYF